MINKIFEETEKNMIDCENIFKQYLNKIHSNNVTLNLLDKIKVEYYNNFLPLYKLASVFKENRNMFIINTFDNTIVNKIKEAIEKSNLGLNPYICGKIIRVPIPLLTEERRKSLIKIIRLEAEKIRVSIRNIRRNANNKIKRLLKDNLISNDEDHKYQIEIQNRTNKYIDKINVLLKEKEIILNKI